MNYARLEILHQNQGTTLYRAWRDGDQRPVILKVCDPARCRPKDPARLRNELLLSRALEAVPGVVKPLALECHQGMPALVLEDFAGQSLDHFLGAPMALPRFLELAARITEIIVGLHRQGIIHKDLKPQNILVSPASGEIKLTDFGLASRLLREPQPAQPLRLIEGSLPYMAPEQTGRTNRAIDQRTDLYSLGIIFYQMLTGQLPFTAHDPVEWVHCHVARVPASPADLVADVPLAAAGIILKLLSKMPEDRYQSARGLWHDWRCCQSAETSGCASADFVLGQCDVPERMQVPQKLYGREVELELLRKALARVITAGTPELVLVSGYSGIGKSSLVSELHKPVVGERGFFAAGKFDQFKRNIPYSTLVQAFQELVLELLAGTEQQIETWRERLLGALSGKGQLLVEVIPAVELLLGPQAPVPALPPSEAQHRFQRVLGAFIGVFARAEHPLVLFLDDLQWADSASLDLLTEVVARSQLRHLLVIGAYRDNEVSSAHPLVSAVEQAVSAGACLTRIVLGPIPREPFIALVGDALYCRHEQAAPLGDLVHDKTAGNPFFAIQFLHDLYEEGLIWFDQESTTFRWDMAQIHAKCFTANVADLMVGKLRRLPAETQELLQLFACLGNRADAALLDRVCGGPEQRTHEGLWAAVQAGLVLRQNGTYKFLHDRVHEAAYSLIAEGERAALHLRIGRLLLGDLCDEAVAEQIFDIVNQLNQGAALIADPDEKRRLSRLNHEAGRKARAATAYGSARGYLEQAAKLLSEEAWSAQYEDTIALYLELSECEYLVGNCQRADNLVELILDHARAQADRARAYRVRSRLCQMAGRHRDAVAVMLTALRLYGMAFPESDAEIQAATQAELEQVPLNLRGRRIADLVDVPPNPQTHVVAIIGLLAEVIPMAYAVQPGLWPVLTVKGVNFSLQNGHCEETAWIYSCYAMILVSICDNVGWALQFSELALRLNERFTNAALRGKLLFHHGGLISFWCRHFAASQPLLDQAFGVLLDGGDVIYAGYLTYNHVWLLLEEGAALDQVIELARKYTAFAQQTHNEVVYHVVRLEEQFAASLKGTTREPTSFSDSAFEEAGSLAVFRKAGFGIGIAYYYILKQMAAYIHERPDQALAAAGAAAVELGSVASMASEATHCFYHALTLAALCPTAAGEPADHLKTLHAYLGKLKRWADDCPQNFYNRYVLVAAEIARIEGHDLQAMRLYDEAIRSAQNNGFVHYEALAHEVAARFYRARGFAQIADTYLRGARVGYARWGADCKVKQLEQQHPGLVEPRSLAPTATIAVRAEQLDLLAVIKASQTISGEIDLDQLIRTLLAIVLEQGGADKGVLLRCREELLFIEAEADLHQDGVTTRVLDWVPVDSSPSVPASLLHYVQRTRERVILSAAAAPVDKFSSDEYFARHRPKSVLCVPILRQAGMVGLLYLENNLVAGAFTPDRLIALELLATQAAISLDNARSYLERKQAEGALRDREEWLRLAIEATELGTFDYYPIGGKIISSERNSINLGRPVGTEMNYASFLACLCPDERPRVDKLVQQALDPDGPGLYDVEYRVMWPTGQTHWVKAKGRVFFAEIDGVRRAIRFTGTTMDITQQKQAEAAIKDLTDTLERRVAQRTRELQEAQQELVEAARRAGMAEIAVNVLHNVGNVLNSVNVSASVANGLVRASRIQRLPQLARLLRERDDLPTFLTQDPKGRQVPLYLSQVAEQLEHERTMLMDNLASITKNIDHIKSIVQVQQSYAGWVGVAEYVCPATILADALSINAAGAEPRPIEVVQDYEDIPPLRLDKHKILQILINLISNAQYALRQSTVEHPRLILRLRRVGPRRIRIEVADNGVGIPKENLTRIFQHGFTTRPGGHGFGLHSGALAARALGGSLTVESAGVGHGATFALEVVAEEPAPPRRLSDKADVGPGV